MKIPIMRTAIILLTFVFLQTLHADDFSAVKAVAEQYWDAIRSKDSEKIYALFDPAIFDGLTPEEIAAVKEVWRPNYEMMTTKEGDSYEVDARKWDSDESPFAGKGWHWPIKPQYQFQIQTFKNVENGRESHYVISDLAIEKEGKILIIRPVPSPETAKKLLEKKKG
jgi:hypothetical protein